MRSITTLFFALIATASVYGQSIPVGQDTTVCPDDTVQITASFNASDWVFLDDATSLSLQDDQYSGQINLGFQFRYFGDSSTAIVIGSNGVLTFRTDAANGVCPWSPTQVLPAANTELKSIFCPWQDYNTNTHIRYKTIGVAPNRQFVVQYIPFTGNCAGSWTTTVVLTETTNTIDFYIGNKPSCVSGPIGIINGGGTIYYDATMNSPSSVTGWFARRLTRLSNTQYDLSTIPYVMYADSSFLPVWVTDGGLESFTPSISLSPSAASDAWAFIAISSPLLQAPGYIPYSDTSVVSPTPPLTPTGTQTTSVTCFGEHNGSITVIHTVATPPFDVIWDNEVTSDMTFDSLAPGTYHFQLIDTFGCIKPMTAVVAGSSAPLEVVVVVDSSEAVAYSFSLAVSGGTPPYAYYLDSEAYNGPDFDSLAVGTYAVVVVDHYGCADTTIVGIPIMLQLGVSEISNFPLVTGPNPVSDRLFVHGLTTPFQIAVRSMHGAELQTVQLAADGEIDLSGLASGTYFLVCSDGKGTEWVKTFVKK